MATGAGQTLGPAAAEFGPKPRHRAHRHRGPDAIFSTFLTESAPQVDALAGIDRPCSNATWPGWSPSRFGHGAKEDAVTAPGAFFQAIRQHGWDDSLPTTAVFFPGDTPPRPPRSHPPRWPSTSWPRSKHRPTSIVGPPPRAG